MSTPSRSTPPTLKHAARGFYYTRWGGLMFTFGSEKSAAEERFSSPTSTDPGSLVAWQRYNQARQQQAAARPPHQRRTARAGATIEALYQAFVKTYDDEGRYDTADYYRTSLRRFVQACGPLPAHVFDINVFESFRLDLIRITKPGATARLAPKTIAHDLKAVKTFWRWCCIFHPQHCRAIELSGIKVPRQMEPVPHPISKDALRSMIDRGAAVYPELRSWLSLAYLACLRPSEVLRIAAGAGGFVPLFIPPQGRRKTTLTVPEGLYAIQSKVQHLTGSLRYVVLSDLALMHLKEVQRPSVLQSGPRRGQLGPRWTRLDNFSASVIEACGHGPSVLRDTGASDLHAAGVGREVVDQILGHVPSSVSRSYIQTTWHIHRAAVARLTL